MFKELQSLKDKINNAHMDWVDLKVNGVLNEKAIAEIEKIDWPSFPESSLEDYCEGYNYLAVHYSIEYGTLSISAIVYGDAAGFMFDLYDLYELSGDDDLLVGSLKTKSLEDAKKETEGWIKGGLREEISIDRFDDVFSRYFKVPDDALEKSGTQKKKLEPGMVIQCQNILEACDLLKQLHDEGYRWYDGVRLTLEVRYSKYNAYYIVDNDSSRCVYSISLDILHESGFHEIMFTDLEDKGVMDDNSNTTVSNPIYFPVVKDIALLEKAIDQYGGYPQTDMVIEEMSELTKAVLKYRRATQKGMRAREEALSDIREETADVIIMLTQLLIMYGGDDEIQDEIDRKVKRLAERLAKYKED